jgi:hypothetical protein
VEIVGPKPPEVVALLALGFFIVILLVVGWRRIGGSRFAHASRQRRLASLSLKLVSALLALYVLVEAALVTFSWLGASVGSGEPLGLVLASIVATVLGNVGWLLLLAAALFGLARLILREAAPATVSVPSSPDGESGSQGS